VNTTLVRQDLAAKFEDKDYRDAFVAEQIFSRLPLKIRCMREDQELTQKQLGTLAGMAQTWVSKLEDPNYGKLTISTLLKLASAFDVGLQVDFVPFSRILDDSLRLSTESFVVTRFEVDAGLSENQGVTGTRNVTVSNAAMATVIAFPSYAVAASSGDATAPPKSASSAAQQSVSAIA
jgi:transcriptional regulator with XRE-family HTH domain